MEYLLIFLKNKISLYGSKAYIEFVLSLAGSRYYSKNKNDIGLLENYEDDRYSFFNLRCALPSPSFFTFFQRKCKKGGGW